MKSQRYLLIFLQSGMIVWRHHLHDEQALQIQYPDYLTALGPWTWTELLEFLAAEYPAQWTDWQAALTQLITSDAELVVLD